jgi:hypothetical protein
MGAFAFTQCAGRTLSKNKMLFATPNHKYGGEFPGGQSVERIRK